MNPRYNKTKGMKAQKEVRDILLEAYPQFEEDDCRTATAGAPGEDLLLSPAMRKVLPWSIEVKSKKQSTPHTWYAQAASQNHYEPVVFCKKNHDKWLTIISTEYFLKLKKAFDKVGDSTDS